MKENGKRLLELISGHSGKNSDASAILASGRVPMTYGNLLKNVVQSAALLSQLGIRRNDRISLVMPNGPEMVTAFLAVTSIATCAPLNPSYSLEEFKFYLTDLNAKVVIVGEGLTTMAVEAARQLAIQVLVLRATDHSEAGAFTIVGESEGQEGRQVEFSEPDDVALVLHTSGTTGRPKIVPLTHNNIAISANNVAKSLSLTSVDRCLNVMPLFHVHGLVGAVLASLASGGSVVCTSGFNAMNFLSWLDEFAATWYTAVPTMHQAILAQWDNTKKQSIKNNLRFIRSCSSALPPQVAEKLESVFFVPVVEAYGMTEAAHQMAINPLPPNKRKTGSVGKGAGCNIGIMDSAGSLLPPGVIGEIVVSGDNVIEGYENNPKANESSFANGWFRTGDQGYLDTEGYLFINGRLKELINRGGEKISPREVDEVLLRHPAIQQAAAFAIPHPTLGEDIAAIVVLRNGMTATEKEIRLFSTEYMAYYKVPSIIIFSGEIPKGPTGKVQRVGLAEKLGLTGTEAVRGSENTVHTKSTIEQIVADIWGEIFGLSEPEMNDDFFHLGGNSIQAMQIITRIQGKTGIILTFPEFFDSPTLAEMAALVQMRMEVPS